MVQRDKNYRETKLIVRYRQGKEAITAFNRQRRLPALAVGGFLFATGISFSLATYLFRAPYLCVSLGFSFGVMPGCTGAGLALLPGDDAIIEKVMRVLAGVGVVFGFLYAYRALPLVNSLRGVGYDTCIDQQHSNAPCWVSAIQAASFFGLSMLTMEVVSRRLFASLYYKRDISGRLDLLWRNWARWLIGWTIISTMFLLPFFFYTSGRSFLISGIGVVDILITVELAVLSKFSFTKKCYTRLQERLATFGTVSDAMAVATLMSQGGDKPLEEVMKAAKKKLRYVTLSSMDSSDFNFGSGGSNRSHSNFAKAVPCRPRDIDIFVSHSWRDPPLKKWEVLRTYCAKFESEVRYGRRDLIARL